MIGGPGVTRQRVLLGLVGVLVAAAVASAGVVISRAATGGPGDNRGPDRVADSALATVRILASTELGDLAPVLEQVRRDTGITVELDRVETPAGAQLVAAGQADGGYDGVWFDTDRYLEWTDASRYLDGGSKIMMSPVLLALRATVLTRLGWDVTPVTWPGVAEAARQRRFSFGMSDPTRSSSGQSALLTATMGLAGEAAGLGDSDVTQAAGQLRDLFGAQAISRANAADLAEAFTRGTGGPVDGLFTYEAQILRLAAGAAPDERLVGVYPSDGVTVGDGTFALHALLRPRTADASVTIARLTRYLLRAPTQELIACRTFHRPIVTGVDLSRCGLPATQLFDRPFPRDRAITDRLVTLYQNRYRRPGRTLFVLDRSGSMQGTRIKDLRAALTALTAGPDGQDRFREREQVILLPFASSPDPPAVIDIPAADPGPALARIRATVDALRPAGGTALYEALITGYTQLAGLATTDPDRIVSIVLVTDGASNRGRGITEFLTTRAGGPASLTAVPVYPVLVGAADEAQMRQLAAATGGQVLDARQSDLAAAITALRANQ